MIIVDSLIAAHPIDDRFAVFFLFYRIGKDALGIHIDMTDVCSPKTNSNVNGSFDKNDKPYLSFRKQLHPG